MMENKKINIIKFRNEDCPLAENCEYIAEGECKDNHKECPYYQNYQESLE